jgi:hypothetical protein
MVGRLFHMQGCQALPRLVQSLVNLAGLGHDELLKPLELFHLAEVCPYLGLQALPDFRCVVVPRR